MENLSTLLQLFTLTAILVFESSSEATTCTAGNFTLGQDANLTCHFPKDIYKGKICILYHPASGSQNTKDIMCPVEKLDKGARRWNGRYELWTGSKYNAVVTIKAVTKEDAGNYLCQFVPPGPMDATSCSLNVEAKHEATTPDSVRNPQPTTSPGNVSLTHASRDEDGKTYVKEIGIGAAAFLVVLVFILGAVIFLIHKRKTKDRNSSKDEEQNPMNQSRPDNEQPHNELNTAPKTFSPAIPSRASSKAWPRSCLWPARGGVSASPSLESSSHRTRGRPHSWSPELELCPQAAQTKSSVQFDDRQSSSTSKSTGACAQSPFCQGTTLTSPNANEGLVAGVLGEVISRLSTYLAHRLGVGSQSQTPDEDLRHCLEYALNRFQSLQQGSSTSKSTGACAQSPFCQGTTLTSPNANEGLVAGVLGEVISHLSTYLAHRLGVGSQSQTPDEDLRHCLEYALNRLKTLRASRKTMSQREERAPVGAASVDPSLSSTNIDHDTKYKIYVYKVGGKYDISYQEIDKDFVP